MSGVEDPSKPALMDRDVREQFAAFGVAIETGEAVPDDAFAVWDINWKSFEVFLACETQWLYANGFQDVRRTGINYCSLDVLMRRLKAKAAVFADVQIMERAALTLFGEADNG